MAKASDAWKVLPHDPILKLADNLWCVVGAIPGMTLRRVMTLARMTDGRLVVHSAIALKEDDMAEVEKLGAPAFILVPNGGHRMDAPAYKRRFPGARVLAPRGSRAKVEEVVAVDGTYEDFPSDAAVRLVPLHGVNDAEGAMIVRSPDGATVVLNDVVFNMDKKTDFLGFLFTTLFASAPGPRVSRLAKWLLIKDAKALRADLENLAATPDLTRLVVSHEKIASGREAAEALRKAATYL